MKRRVLTGFVDVLFLMVLVLVVLLVPPRPEAESKPPGSLAVEIRWPDGMDADVDLWMKSPNDTPVGYSRREGNVFNLLRDDLGASRDFMLLNFENGFSRGAPDGEYIINLHLYSSRAAPPVPVDVRVMLHRPGALGITVYEGKTVLQRIGEEATVIRFSMSGGDIVDGSFHDLPVRLR